METDFFDQMAFIRSQTLEAMEGVTEEFADRIPAVSAIISVSSLVKSTPEQSIRYSLYHEGLHFGIISDYK